MARSIHLEILSPADADNVLEAFGDATYWQARLAAFSNGTATLDALEADGGGRVTAAITLHLLRDRLPKVIRQLRPGDLVMKRTERWSLGADGHVLGELTANMPGAPFSMTGEARIAPTDPGSRLDYTATIDVRVPLVGGRIESYIAAQAGKEVGTIHRFTGEWIAANV